MTALDRQLIEAHTAGDTTRLARLYSEAAAAAHDVDVAAFYLTHAYVFALEAGLPDAPDLRRRLIDMGRETPLQP